MLKKCKIQVKDFQMIITLRKTITAEEIWKALPIKSTVNTWGDEVYFFTSVDALVEDNANDVINLGEIAYWPSGKAIAIGFGKTPASIDKEISLTGKLIQSLKYEEEKARKTIYQLKNDILENENKLEALRTRYKQRVLKSYKKGRLTDLQKVFSSTTSPFSLV